MSKRLMHSHQIFDVHPAAVNAELRSKQIRAVMEGRVVSREKKRSGRSDGVTEAKPTDKRGSGGGGRGAAARFSSSLLLNAVVLGPKLFVCQFQPLTSSSFWVGVVLQ